MKNISILFTLVSLNIFSFAQLSWTKVNTKLEVHTKFIVDQGNTNGFTVTLLRDTTVVETFHDKSDPTFWLEYNHKYIIRLSKEGYTTKTVAFLTTNISIETWNTGFEPYKMQLTIFKQTTDNLNEYPQPVSTIFFNPSIDDFDYKVNYTKSKE